MRISIRTVLKSRRSRTATGGTSFAKRPAKGITTRVGAVASHVCSACHCVRSISTRLSLCERLEYRRRLHVVSVIVRLSLLVSFSG